MVTQELVTQEFLNTRPISGEFPYILIPEETPYPHFLGSPDDTGSASQMTGERHRSQNALIRKRALGEMNFLETVVAVTLGLEATLVLPWPSVTVQGTVCCASGACGQGDCSEALQCDLGVVTSHQVSNLTFWHIWRLSESP